MRKVLNNKKGFSLMELMIVVVIMGILIAVAIPLYFNVVNNSKNSTCESNIDAIRSAAIAYCTEHGKPVTADNWDEVLTFDDGVPKCPWGEGDENYSGYTISEVYATGEVKVVCGATHLD